VIIRVSILDDEEFKEDKGEGGAESQGIWLPEGEGGTHEC